MVASSSRSLRSARYCSRAAAIIVHLTSKPGVFSIRRPFPVPAYLTAVLKPSTGHFALCRFHRRLPPPRFFPCSTVDCHRPLLRRPHQGHPLVRHGRTRTVALIPMASPSSLPSPGTSKEHHPVQVPITKKPVGACDARFLLTRCCPLRPASPSCRHAQATPLSPSPSSAQPASSSGTPPPSAAAAAALQLLLLLRHRHHCLLRIQWQPCLQLFLPRRPQPPPPSALQASKPNSKASVKWY